MGQYAPYTEEQYRQLRRNMGDTITLPVRDAQSDSTKQQGQDDSNNHKATDERKEER